MHPPTPLEEDEELPEEDVLDELEEDEELDEDELEDDELLEELDEDELLETRQSPLLTLPWFKQIGSEVLFILGHSLMSVESSHLKTLLLLHLEILSRQTGIEFESTVPHRAIDSLLVVELKHKGSASLFTVIHSFIAPASQLDVSAELTH